MKRHFDSGLGPSATKGVLLMKVQRNRRMRSTPQLASVFVASRTYSHYWQNVQGCLVVALFFLLVGCSSGPTTIPFLNHTHRQAYSLNENDLKKVQFYVSKDIVAQVQDPMATQSFVVPRLTPGVVTAAGPNWIKVSFRKGGADVPFVADPNQNDSWYYIASEVEGGRSFKRVTEVPGTVFIYKGTPLTLISGADAMLLLDWDSWKEVAETRKVTEGRRVGDK
jgi:hypothetical protein